MKYKDPLDLITEYRLKSPAFSKKEIITNTEVYRQRFIEYAEVIDLVTNYYREKRKKKS